MKKRLVLQSFIITLIVLIAVFIASVCTFYFIQQKKIKEDLVVQAGIITALYSENPSALESLDTGEMRITVISEEGDVLFDSSSQDVDIFDNHLSREEIEAALNGSPCVVKRYSDTLKCNMFYYAVVCQTSDGEKAVLRIAQPESSVWTYTGAGLIYLAIAIVFAIVMSILLAERLSSKVNDRLKQLRDNLRNINSGNYAVIDDQSDDALNLSILNEMNEIVRNLQSSYDSAQNEKTKLYNIINNMTQGVIVVDGNYKTVLINNVASDLFNAQTENDILENVISDKYLYDCVTSSLNAGKSEPFAYTFGNKDLAVNAFKIHVNGSEDKLGIILISDVTKEKELSRQKSVFFANASHELKTPLTSVQGLSESLLARTDENSPSFKYLKRIYTESVRLHNIVMDMLYISKLEAKSIDKISENVNIRKVAEECFLNYSKEISEKSLSCTIDGDACIFADAHNIYECVNNLIGNAVHYNKNNGSVSVKLEMTEEFVTMSVCDSGIGISDEHLPHICERFYRVDKSRSKSTGGTGLGLAIVKHIVMLYNGQLDIKSKLGEGTCVKITLPKENE